MNELKALIRELNEEVKSLSRDVESLDATQKQLTRKHRAERARTAILTVVVIVQSLMMASYWLVIRPEARRDTRNQTKDLACTLVLQFPPGSGPLLTKMNDKYGCYPAPPSKTPTATASPSVTRSHGHAAAPPTPTRSATVVVVRGSRAIVTRPAATRTRVVAGPTRTRTVHATTTPHATSTTVPTPTGNGIRSLLCGQLHIPVCPTPGGFKP